MTWVGELSSIKLSMGQKRSSNEKGTSDSAPEIVKLDQVEETFCPIEDQAYIDQLYQPVEPSQLISKQQTTSIYLTRTQPTTT